MTNKQISPERQGLYYFGIALVVVGALSFGSVFVSGILHFGDFTDFAGQARSAMTRAFGGMVLIIIGGILQGVGRMGAAGSGIVLDPERAREDVEPWARMAGGVVKDALDEAGIASGQHQHADALPFDEQLRRLHKLREEGILSEAEYEAKKKQILEQA